MAFKLPASYRAYCADPAVRTAVDHILESKSLSLPAYIKWSDLPAFHRMVLSAHQVRCEYAMFLIEFWDAVWGRSLRKVRLGSDTGRIDHSGIEIAFASRLYQVARRQN